MRSYAQIPQWDHTESATVQPELLSRQGVFRIYWLTAIVCCGGILFGYDSGVIGWFKHGMHPRPL